MTRRPTLREDARQFRRYTKRHTKDRRIHPQNPCNSGPMAPTVEMTFQASRHLANEHWTGKIRWEEVDVDEAGFPIEQVDRYEVQWQATDAAGNPYVDQEDNFIYKLTSAKSVAGGATYQYFTSTNVGLAVGDTVVVRGCTPAGFNGTYTVTAQVHPKSFEVAGHGSLTDTNNVGYVSDNNLQSRGHKTLKSPIAQVHIKKATNPTGPTLEFETRQAHGQFVGNKVRVKGCHPQTAYNGVHTVSSIINKTTLRVTSSASGVANCQHPGVLSDADDSLFVITGTLPLPHRLYWQARVRAHSKNCWGIWSDWTTPQLPSPPPGLPLNVTIYDKGIDRIILDWDWPQVDDVRSGLVTIANGSADVIGTGTHFLEEFDVGDVVVVGAVAATVVSVTDATTLAVGVAWTTDLAGVPIYARVNDPNIRRWGVQISRNIAFNNLYKHDLIGHTSHNFKIKGPDTGDCFYGRVRAHSDDDTKSAFVNATLLGNSTVGVTPECVTIGSTSGSHQAQFEQKGMLDVGAEIKDVRWTNSTDVPLQYVRARAKVGVHDTSHPADGAPTINNPGEHGIHVQLFRITNLVGLLNTNIADTDTTLLIDVTGPGDPPNLPAEFTIKVDDELMRVTGRSGSAPRTYVITRGYTEDGVSTTAAAHNAGAHIIGDPFNNTDPGSTYFTPGKLPLFENSDTDDTRLKIHPNGHQDYAFASDFIGLAGPVLYPDEDLQAVIKTVGTNRHGANLKVTVHMAPVGATSEAATSGGPPILPTGGYVGQVLTKLSTTDYDADWLYVDGGPA